MKPIIAIIAIAAFAFANQPSAQADDKTRAIIGGVIGGIIIGKALEKDHHSHVEVGIHSSSGHRGQGYYKWVSVRVWVPGSYHYHYDDCGHRYKVWSRGYYTTERRKVWVSESRHGHHDDCHRDDRHREDHRRSDHRSNDRYDSRDRYASCDF